MSKKVHKNYKNYKNYFSSRDVNSHIDFQLPLRQTAKNSKHNFRATLKELYDLTYLMKDTENVKTHTKTVNLMARQIK